MQGSISVVLANIALTAIVMLILFFPDTSSSQDIEYVSPYGGEVVVSGRKVETKTLRHALDHPQPGTTYLLTPGTYTGTYNLQAEGSSSAPVKIVGMVSKKGRLLSTFDGQSSPTNDVPSCFIAKRSSWLIFESLKIKNCWPYFLYLKSSRNIALRNSKVTDSKYVVYAKDPTTHSILIDNNKWVQDPSKKIWKDIPWNESHHGTHSYLNGGLFGSKNILGNVTFRNNYVRYAFNAIRMRAEPGMGRNLNSNVNIENNRFAFIRDNVVEPEGSGQNWWTHGNTIKNAHAWFSLTEARVGYFYFFGNVGFITDKPCYPDKPDHCNGKVFKFEKIGPYPIGPIYIFHNSWYLKSSVFAGGLSRNIKHYNNAIEFEDPKGFFLEPLMHDSYDFDYDLSNKKFDSILRSNDHEVNGIRGDPGFTNPQKGDFSLTASSIAVDKGRKLKFFKWRSVYEGQAPDIGAFEGNKRFVGPSYRANNEVDKDWRKYLKETRTEHG